MASTVGALKGALLVAVFVVLLHSSMGQQPMPAPAPTMPLNCSTCTQGCYQHCQAIADSDYSKCSNISQDVYAGCFKGCSTHCNGNSAYARGSCEIGSCTANCCGSPCERSCCEGCTISAGQAAYQCTAAAGRVMQYCMPSCTNGCSEYCVSGSAPPPMA
ncbi:hypothetical protein SEVIR_3G308700v4 [Setaria viridis]|uniref:Uncharacterized protein n=1 Tax=Setaria viridis TaxID=4556 RepID=A0A4U6VHJ9_SETVI|nr:hypothetical protein SEVIR_3G308700v2 [Setaria viridis]